MKPSAKMNAVINGKRYNVATATLLASDNYWDGHNFERHGRNTFLYKTRGGAFFQVNLTQWENERDTITALAEEEAKELYESLQEHEVDYETAFDTIVEEATSGRPMLYDQPMKQVAILLPEEMITWLKSQPDKGMSEVIRDLITASMK